MANNNHYQYRLHHITAAVLILVITVFSGCSGQKKTYRIGVISGFDAFLGIVDGFKSEMEDLGYTENNNIIYDVRKEEADPRGMRETANDFVKQKVDLILSFPTETSLIAKEAAAGTGIPVVFANANIEGNSLVESIRVPGDNITGIRTMLTEQTIKRLEMLHNLVPAASRVFIPHDTDYPGLADMMDKLKPAAEEMNITLVEASLNTAGELEAYLKTLEENGNIGMDAVMIIPTRLPVSEEGFDIINAFSVRHNLPLAGTLPYMTDRGALFNFALNHFDAGRLAASLADKIFRGTPAGTIPVITAELALRINYKRAQELGIELPEGLLVQAAEIIR